MLESIVNSGVSRHVCDASLGKVCHTTEIQLKKHVPVLGERKKECMTSFMLGTSRGVETRLVRPRGRGTVKTVVSWGQQKGA